MEQLIWNHNRSATILWKRSPPWTTSTLPARKNDGRADEEQRQPLLLGQPERKTCRLLIARLAIDRARRQLVAERPAAASFSPPSTPFRTAPSPCRAVRWVANGHEARRAAQPAGAPRRLATPPWPRRPWTPLCCSGEGGVGRNRIPAMTKDLVKAKMEITAKPPVSPAPFPKILNNSSHKRHTSKEKWHANSCRRLAFSESSAQKNDSVIFYVGQPQP